jgi:hypothetical protein
MRWSDEAEQAWQQIGTDVTADMQPDQVWTSGFGRRWGASLAMRHAEQASRNLAGTAGRSITPGRRRAGSADPTDPNSRLGIPHSCARKVRAKMTGCYVEDRAHGHPGRIESHFRFDQPDVGGYKSAKSACFGGFVDRYGYPSHGEWCQKRTL